ncbi:BsaA family SipW-dependent biofilm matrix protein [Ruminococcus flavefaciens]|uniref:BsaA family SipW-dependent biofilm matrix protein n=1 Tax=Ruminococcus flavefaciens TaxID=1265 RepID=UPI0003067B18|nr:BsaA family SipW-dependent biofilm matrix protein [Ruminococcus flavefaciens]
MKNNNEKKDKKILIGALGVAAVIAAGSTFAWFTSSDEVTNRLTASADYGVSISESFTPPTEWLPGQEIKKEVAAVNTGNIAAYVRLDLKHALQGTQAGDGVAYSSSVATTGLTPLTANEIKTLEAGGYLAYPMLKTFQQALLPLLPLQRDFISTADRSPTVWLIRDITATVQTTITALLPQSWITAILLLTLFLLPQMQQLLQATQTMASFRQSAA